MLSREMFDNKAATGSKLLLKDMDFDSKVLNQFKQSFKGTICNTPRVSRNV